MTVRCGGLTSAPQGWVAPVVDLGSAGVALAIGAAGFPEVGAVVGAFLAPLLQLDSVSFCATDPPPDPGITSSDLADAINYSNPLISVPAQAKFLQWFQSLYWCKICQCSDGTTPCGSAPSNPGPLGNNDGLPTAGPSAPCWNFTFSATIPPVSGAPLVNFDQAFPTTQLQSVTPWSTGSPNMVPTLPTGTPNITMAFTWSAYTLGAAAVEGTLAFYNAAGSSVALDSMLNNPSHLGGTFTRTVAVPSTATAWVLDINGTGAGGSVFPFSLETSFPCSGNTTSSITAPCCPPDPILDAKLDQLIGLVNYILSIVPIRPVTYVAGAAHTALSGSGNVTLGIGTIAIQVQFTTLPVTYGEELGFPNRYFGMGNVTPATSEGPVEPIRLDLVTKVIPLPDATESVDYFIDGAGVVTITELQSG